MKKFSIRSGWPLALLVGAVYCANLWLSAKGLVGPTLMLVLALFISVVVAALQPASRPYVPALFLLSVIGFPQYLPDPYAPEFVAPFKFAKFVALGCLFLMLKPAPSRGGIAFLALLTVATGVALFNGKIGDVGAEIWYVLFIAVAFNAKCRPDFVKSASLLLSALERLFYLLIPIGMFTRATGLHDERAGETVVYFYGHWVGIVTAFAIYAAFSRQSVVFSFSWIRIVLLVITIYFNMASYQSAHFVLFIIALSIVMLQRGHRGSGVSSLLLPSVALVSLLAGGAILLARVETHTWLYLKISQLYLLTSGNVIDASNSVMIRASQFLSIFEQGTVWSILFGRGAFSTYLASGAYWDTVIFHEATFPERELLAGELQYIHESVVMLLKWAGLVGLGLAYLGAFRLRTSALVDRGTATLVATIFLMFFASSLQAGLLITGLFVLSTGFIRHASNQARD
jgi:hypothetical protein